MKKIYYEALKKLPDEFMDDDTQIAIMLPAAIVAAHPNYPPIIYNPDSGEWTTIKFSDEAPRG